MNNTVLSVAALLAISVGSVSAADLPVKADAGAAATAAFERWDVAFGSAITNDYLFRGITQSNHKPSVSAYFEPRYNVSKDLQFYAGSSFESISFPNRAATEVDVYAGVRPTFGAVAFDFGGFGYLYPGGRCFNANAFPGSGTPGSEAGCVANADPSTGGLPINGNVAKRDFSYFEVFAKMNWTVTDTFTLGTNAFYSPNFLNTGAEGTYASVTGKVVAPGSFFGSSGIGMFVSGEFGRQWLGTSDRFYAVPAFPNGINYTDYNTWNIGVAFTYKVFTLDLRYSDTSLSRGDCNAFISDHTATQTGFVTPINPGGFGSTWCGATGVIRLSADLTAASNLR